MDLREQDTKADMSSSSCAIDEDATDPATGTDKLREGLCVATTGAGRLCTRRGKGVHPDLGVLCGIHMKVAARQVECCICLGPVKRRQTKQLECGHTFHRRCIKKWFGRGSLTCPMCRSVCLSELGGSHALVSMRLRHLLRVLPPPPSVCFAAYMLGLLNSEPVLRSLDVTPEQQQLLIELAYQSFTQNHFFEYLRQLHL